MKTQFIPEERLNKLVQITSTSVTPEVLTEVNEAEAEFPCDERIHYLRHALHNAVGLSKEALDDLWSCLEIKPKEMLFEEAISDLVMSKKGSNSTGRHNLSLNSGERQVAEEIGKIRADHAVRYKLAATLLADDIATTSTMTGLDLFSGNGYGSRIVHNLIGARMVGIDGSNDAVTLANKTYGNHRVKFVHNYFPFGVRHNLFDFVICYESVEHVEDYVGLLNQIFNATEGPIFLSVPAEETLKFNSNKRFFKFHTKHFLLDEIKDLCADQKRHKLKNVYGQTVYRLQDGVVAGLVSQDQMYIRPTYPDSQFHLLHFGPL